MEPFKLAELEFMEINRWIADNPALTAGFSMKNGGKSSGTFSSLNIGFHVNDRYEDVVDNRKHLAELLSFPLENWVGAEQTHEIHIEKITADHKGLGASRYGDSIKRTDGLYTFDKDVLLTLCYADCVPLFFMHRQSGAVAVAHAGWKGTVGGIAKEMVQVLEKEGVPAGEIECVIGPSICGDCYVVDDHVISFVKKIVDAGEIKPYNELNGGQYQLNLKKLNEQIMLRSGLKAEHIQVTNFCTSCDHELFFSHRKDKGKTGRMIAFIGWKEDYER